MKEEIKKFLCGISLALLGLIILGILSEIFEEIFDIFFRRTQRELM